MGESPKDSSNKNKSARDRVAGLCLDIIYWLALAALLGTICHSLYKQSVSSRFVRLEDISSLMRFYGEESTKQTSSPSK